MSERDVDTRYGPLPGCRKCGVIALGRPHICEHGVTVPDAVEFSATITFDDPALYLRMLYGREPS